MAKTVGSDAKDPKLPARAGPDMTNAVVTEGSFLNAVKEITASTLKVKLANEERKNLRKKWKASGISLGQLDTVVKMAEWSRGEIRDHFTIEKTYAQWLGLPVDGRQGDAFKGLADDEIQRREWHAAGKTASRTGKPARPPEECPEEFHQAFMRGFNDEDEAAWSEAEQPDQVEGAATGATGAAAIEEPADMPAMPEWAEWDYDPAKWTLDQAQQFQAWFDALPAQAEVRVSHPGALVAFQDARKVEVDLGEDRAADAPVLVEETADERRNRIFTEGVHACRENVPRDDNPHDGDDGKLWLDGWEHQANKESADIAAQGVTGKGKAPKAKGLH